MHILDCGCVLSDGGRSWCPTCAAGGTPLADPFGAETAARDRANVQKWGHQNGHILLLVLGEEMGEVAEAVAGGDPDRIRSECVDAAAVLRRIYLEADRAGGAANPELESAGEACRAELKRLFP